MTLAAPEISESAQEQLLLQHCMSGLDAQQRGDMSVAIESFRLALGLAPSNLDMRLLLAYAQGSSGDKDAAACTLGETPRLDSLNEADARRVADAATSLGADHVALRVVERVLTFSSSDPNLHATLGALHHRTGNTQAATVVLHRAQTRWPKHVPTLMNRARLLADSGDYGNASSLYDGVLALSPEHAAARWYRGLLRLMLGDFPGGWTDHEARRQLPFMQSVTPTGIPSWNGESLEGRTVLMWGEQGLGDQIMAARFATVLAERGARVVVRCAQSLVTVMRSVAGVSEVVANGDALPSCDCHVPMLSVPFLCRLFDDAGLGNNAYLQAVGTPTDAVRDVIGEGRSVRRGRRARIAVVWAGSSMHGNDRNRSMPREQLAALIAGADVDWVSLQMGERRADLDLLPQSVRERVTDASLAITDFKDTAHVLRNCDMVVSVDTSVAHLAGAMGVPTLAMIPCVPDWRWQVARRDTPWYPAMRLVRQPMAGAWEHVIDVVHRAVNSGTA